MSSSPSLLPANSLCYSLGHQELLTGALLSISPGHKAGLVSRNGCGKPTSRSIPTGPGTADSGEISQRRNLRVGYLPQEFELNPDQTVLQNIEAGAADLLDAIRRYESGEGSETALAELLDTINHADGWNLPARIRALSGAL